MSLKELREIYKDIECKVCSQKIDPITKEDFDNDSNLFMYADQNDKVCFCYLIESLFFWVYWTTDSNVDNETITNFKDPLTGNSIPYNTILRLHREYKKLYPPQGYKYDGVEFTKKELEEFITQISGYSDKVSAANDILLDEIDLNDDDEEHEDVVKMKAILGWYLENI